MKPLNPLRPSVPFLYPHGSLIFSGDIKREYCDLKVWVTSKACFNFSYTHFIIKWERWDVKGLTILKFRKNEIANWKKLTPSKMLFVKYLQLIEQLCLKKKNTCTVITMAVVVAGKIFFEKIVRNQKKIKCLN